MDRLTFSKNTAAANGVLFFHGQDGDQNISITNSIFAANQAKDDSAALQYFGFRTAMTVTTTNNTFSANASNANGGVIMAGAHDATLIHNSTNDLVHTAGDELAVRIFTVTAAASVTLNRQFGIFGTVGVESVDMDSVHVVDGPSVFSADPQFVKAGKDVHLLATSPAIDSGTCSGAPPVDIGGVSRPFGAGCDMGAFERWEHPFVPEQPTAAAR